MNFYIKKLCVLKQLSSGFAADGKKVSALATAETYAGKLTVNLSLINFAPLSEGRYRAALIDEHGTAELFDVTGPNGCSLKKASAIDLEDGFGCVVAFVSGKVSPVAFGKCGDKVYDVKKICAMLGEEEEPKNGRSDGGAKNAPPSGKDASAPPKKNGTPETQYDDELVATENYYDYPDADLEHLSLRDGKEKQDADRQQNDPRGEKGKDTAGAGKDEDAQSLFRFAGAENLGSDERACYYEKVKKELTALFSAYPEEDALKKLIPLSQWVRIAFGKGKFYVVGVIREGKKPKYICYGVPAEKRGDPPEALKGWCSFLPASLFDLDGKGYWMMYQDAETGACVRLSQA